jgi:hypothetical protein
VSSRARNEPALNLDHALEMQSPVPDDRYWANVPHEFRLRNHTDWYRLCDALMQRRFYCGENLSRVLHDLHLEGALAHYMGERLNEVASEEQIRKHLTESATTKQYALKPLRKSTVRLRASRIGSAIHALACLDESLVHRVVSTYARVLNTDHQVEMTSVDRHAPFAREFIKFTRGLNISDLDIRLVGYVAADGARTDKSAWLDALGLPNEDTFFRWQRARNTQCTSPARHAGIEAIRTGLPSGPYQDGAFAHVMLMGAIMEMWRFAAPKVLAA